LKKHFTWSAIGSSATHQALRAIGINLHPLQTFKLGVEELKAQASAQDLKRFSQTGSD
jgi:hypothetical protein